MFRNYFKIAVRNLSKQKSIAFINIFGLAVGITCFTLFMLYANNEFSYDAYHKNATHTYLVLDGNGKPNPKPLGGFIYTSMPLGPAMKQELPGVENYVRYIQPYETFIKVKDEGRRESIAYADSSFFHVFSFRFKYGNADAAIRDQHSIVLTEETAKRIFNKPDATGESLQVKIENVFETFVVTGITENPPSNSSFRFNMLVNFDCFAHTMEGKMDAGAWGMNSFMTLVQLKPESKLAGDNKLLAEFRKKHLPQEPKPGGYDLLPLRDMHTSAELTGIKISPVDPKSIWILLSIAAGVLLIACINFTTLSIGRSASRAKEVGIRKVVGGSKKSLIIQFLTESFLLAFLSALIGLVLADFLLPYFNQLSGKELSFSFIQYPRLGVFLAGLVILVGLLSGSYPALILSGFKAVEVLKSKIKIGGANFLTKALVTFQFVLSAGLITSAIIILQQLNYLRSRNPGFDKENVVQIKALGVPDTRQIFSRLKNELSVDPHILRSAGTDNGIGEREGSNISGFGNNGKSITIYQFYTDPDFIPALGMKLLAGRNFDPAISSDSVNSVIINESAMNTLGWTPETSIGKPLDGYENFGIKNPVVIGVVRDINFQALTHQVEPMLFHRFASSNSQPWHFFVRIGKGDPSKVLAEIQSAWKRIAPGYPLKYNFLDEDLDRFYQSEARLSRIIGWAGGIAIFLACLGLLGLAALAAVNRTKEIGIRKVLGASISIIIRLLSKDFVRLVALAFILAIPLTWWFMNKWLQDYVFRIDIEWWVFAISGILITGVALMTVGLQAIKAALSNPVKSLRSE